MQDTHTHSSTTFKREPFRTNLAALHERQRKLEEPIYSSDSDIPTLHKEQNTFMMNFNCTYLLCHAQVRHCLSKIATGTKEGGSYQ